MSNDPTAHGLGITPDQPPKYRDIFEYILKDWLLKEGFEINSEAAINACSFIDHARRMLGANQPIAQDFLGSTLSLRFQDGSVITFCDYTEPGPGAVGGNAGSLELAKQHPQRGAEGKGRTAPSPSWGVTGDGAGK